MVDQAFRWANQEKLSEIIGFQTLPFVESPQFLKQKYLKEGWSARKIANYCDCSKTYVLSCLKKFGIERRKKGCNEAISFGKKSTKSGGIVPFSKELKIAEKIVKMKKDGLSFRVIAKYLSDNQIPTKKGGKWHHFTVRNIYHRHKDKFR